MTLLISDVPGDDPSVIASGPTVADPTTCADALAMLERYGIDVPASVRARLERRGRDAEARRSAARRASSVMIATPQASLEAAAAVAPQGRRDALILGDAIEGEAREVGKVHAGIARQCAPRPAVAPPCVLLSGGETTVTVQGKGRGGRNAEFLLALAIALDGQPGIYALAGDTDGIDGTEDNAGAIVTPDTLARAEAAGLDAKAMLADNDAYASSRRSATWSSPGRR